MRGVGTVWFFREGVANILSQFWIAVYSRWEIMRTTKDHRKIGYFEDLCYKIVTSEGIKCKFTPTLKGLHVLRVNEDTDGCFFGRSISDNSTACGMAMCHTILSESVEVEDDLSAGVNVNRNINLVGALHTNSYDGDDIIENVIRNNTDEENDNQNTKSAGVNSDSSENQLDTKCI